MSMKFPYKLKPVGHSVFQLGGRWVRPRPVILVSLTGPSGLRAQEAILDPAADDTVFSEAMAKALGINLAKAPMSTSSGVGSKGLLVRHAEVTIRLSDGKENRTWRGWVGFTSATLPYPTLGFSGLLQFFSAHFHGDRVEVEPTVNRLYPGT